ncbi:epoxide hydrolase [Bisporella sp. PMI_857]|nr:epoxide hydrolase [Bisporella sp. PMI_857]
MTHMLTLGRSKTFLMLAREEPVPFKLKIDRELIVSTKAKLKLARYPQQELTAEDDWSQGTKLKELKRLAEYWRKEYDWQEEEVLSQSHFQVAVDVEGYGALNIHYVHEVSDREDAMPLYEKSSMAFAHPESSFQPASHVVAPSIPGFDLGPAPTNFGMGPTNVARAFDAVMHRALGYPKYVLQGGDFGSFITRSVAIQFPQRARAQHLNMYQLSSIFYSDWEKKAMNVRRNFEVDQSGYLEQQKTRPQTLGIALGDSPLDLLAWFIEKLHDWVDTDNYSLSDKEVITFVMMHWIQGATPGLRFYNVAFYRSRDTESTFETYVPQSTGVSMYPKDQLHAQRVANIQFWKEHTKGGHFSSVECPDQYLKDIREFFGGLAVTKAFKD